MNLKVKIKLLDQNAKLPVKGSEGAACYDVYASRIEKSEDGYIICHLGFATEILEGWKGIIIPRSNITKYGWAMLNSPGCIDPDFRGEWEVRFTPIPSKKLTNIIDSIQTPLFPYKEGERVAQIYFEQVHDIEFNIVEDISDTKRGIGGHGSTGVK